MATTLTVNAGSSSLKLSLLDERSDKPLAEQELDAPGAIVDPEQLREALSGPMGDADCVAHRVVHGGERFQEAVIVDTHVRAALDELTDLAPLHQPKSLSALDTVTVSLPELPAIACFDTAFHATMPAAASTFALPLEWRKRWGLRRYGFHGLSHAHVARSIARTRGPDLLIISCHLGSGASLCAIDGNKSVDTTMGFTPLDGLVMATRSGSVDPGLLLWLIENTELGATDLSAALEHKSGLLGLAGDADMQEVLRARAQGDPEADLAIDVYLHRLRAGIAAMAASLGGVDVIAFTGGVGEHAEQIRTDALAGLEFLCGSAEVITLHAREDLEMARQAFELLKRRRPA